MKYVKKPVEVEAVQWKETSEAEVIRFLWDAEYKYTNGELLLTTLEGNMLVSDGDYIIRGIEGEFYPCKPSIFEKTYDKVLP